ncbi:MAG: LptA/OstA family protein [Kiritimatiellae bacterium]|nr:LptA/OstA family protein [Kiritimatiellia bacterium]MDD5520232.1 LptA/OstA family protein [Kiritimatiellia bacterium]
MRRIFLICMIIHFAALVMVLAEEPVATNKTTITSDGPLTFDYQRFTAEFEKNVVVVDANMRLHADKLNVVFDNESNMKQAIAIGNVRILQQDKVGTCQKAIFIAKTGEILLVGDAQLKRGNDVVKGDKITFWINEDRMTCEPGNLVIIPTKNSGIPLLDVGGKKSTAEKK